MLSFFRHNFRSFHAIFIKISFIGSLTSNAFVSGEIIEFKGVVVAKMCFLYRMSCESRHPSLIIYLLFDGLGVTSR